MSCSQGQAYFSFMKKKFINALRKMQKFEKDHVLISWSEVVMVVKQCCCKQCSVGGRAESQY